METSRTYQTSETPQIILHYVRGNLSIHGWMQPEVVLDAPNAVAEKPGDEGGALEIQCDGDCRLQVPHGASIHALAVDGNAQLDSVSGVVKLDRVNGDLKLLRVGVTSLGNVNGDLAVRHVDGGIRAKNVSGDAKAHHINGDVEIETINGDLLLHIVGKTVLGQISGDLAARHVGGDLHVERVGGDANINRVDGSFVGSNIGDDLTLIDVTGNVQVTAGDDVSLRLVPQAGSNYAVFAGGDATCRVPFDCSTSVALQAGGEVCVHRLPVEASEDQHRRDFTLGAGDAKVAITAGGDISFIGSDMEWDDEVSGVDIALGIGLRAGELAQQVASQVEAQVQAATSQLDKKLTELANNDDLLLRIQDKVQSAMSVAETKISEAMRQAEQSIREAETRSAQAEAERRRQQQRWHASTPAKPAAAKPAPPVSDEERLVILRMVDEGKISVEQAEQLLGALRAKS